MIGRFLDSAPGALLLVFLYVLVLSFVEGL